MSEHICKHLRTKKMFTGFSVQESFAEKSEENATPSHFWCNRTQSVVGVDDRPAHKNTCDQSRSCYER